MVDYAVITAKDEATTISELLEGLFEQHIYPIVINDGSKDDTGFIAENIGAIVIHHSSPEGIARSLLEAWSVARNMRADRVIQIDAGGSHDPYEARKLLNALDGNDIVIGSRFMADAVYEGRSWRATGSRLAAKMMNWVSRKNYSDWTSGYRAFSSKAIRQLLHSGYVERMHSWQIEVLVEAVMGGLKITEVPITYQAGVSSFKIGMIDGAFRQWLRMFFF